jgi:hypothetical protein
MHQGRLKACFEWAFVVTKLYSVRLGCGKILGQSLLSLCLNGAHLGTSRSVQDLITQLRYYRVQAWFFLSAHKKCIFQLAAGKAFESDKHPTLQNSSHLPKKLPSFFDSHHTRFASLFSLARALRREKKNQGAKMKTTHRQDDLLDSRKESRDKFCFVPQGLLCCLSFLLLFLQVPARAGINIVPFHACTFQSPEFLGASFAGGSENKGCASWSVKRARNGCRKTKGACPLCVTYSGDHLQMWLPEYFIELSTAPGESLFTLTPDGKILAQHLKLATSLWKSPIPNDGGAVSSADQKSRRAAPENASETHFWHARILVMPYGNLMGNYSPLPGIFGTEAPTCFAGISEFFKDQWNFNLIDAPYAFAYAPIGIPLCNTPSGATLAAGVESVRGAVSKAGAGFSFPGGQGEVCGRPMASFGEGHAKLLRPASDVLRPLADPTRLCMGSWGNLVPRTGWSVTSDAFTSAMQAAYKFASLNSDLLLNDNFKVRDSDKWQIVHPPVTPNSCFKPGNPLIPPVENALKKQEKELKFTAKNKGTYLIAVWRKRETCEEPLESFNGWSLAYKAHLSKNKALCAPLLKITGAP